MNNNNIQKYMSHLRVTLLEADHGQVHKTWKGKENILGYNKLYFIEGGEGNISINGKNYSPKPGEILFIPEGCNQKWETISPKPYVKYWLHFNAYIGTTPLNDFLDFPLKLRISNASYIKQVMDRLITYYRSEESFSPIMAHSLLMELIYYYLQELCKDQVHLTSQVNDTKIDVLLSYMEDNLDQKLTINDFSKIMNLHPNYLIRLFKSTFGTSPIDYFNRMKIEKAKELLEINRDTIGSISQRLGFNTPYYFSFVFKKHTGYTPKDYRSLALNRLS